MRNLIRSPLTWMVVAEMVVVGSLIAVAWSVVGSAGRPAVAAAAPVAPVAGAAQDESSAPPDVESLTGLPAPGPLPGLNLGSAFWRTRLADLNRDQVVLADLEWRLVHAGMAAASEYVQNVVLPAVRRAEKAAVG
jgi:hypothetical protein